MVLDAAIAEDGEDRDALLLRGGGEGGFEILRGRDAGFLLLAPEDGAKGAHAVGLQVDDPLFLVDAVENEHREIGFALLSFLGDGLDLEIIGHALQILVGQGVNPFHDRGLLVVGEAGIECVEGQGALGIGRGHDVEKADGFLRGVDHEHHARVHRVLKIAAEAGVTRAGNDEQDDEQDEKNGQEGQREIDGPIREEGVLKSIPHGLKDTTKW